MKVKELRKALKGVPGNINVHLPSGVGIKSAKQILSMNLIGYELHFEVVPYNQNGTKDMQDSLIERETGHPNRVALIEAYKLAIAKIPVEERGS